MRCRVREVEEIGVVFLLRLVNKFYGVIVECFCCVVRIVIKREFGCSGFWIAVIIRRIPLRCAVAFDESVVFVKSPVYWVNLIANVPFSDAIGTVARGFEDFCQCHAVVV